MTSYPDLERRVTDLFADEAPQRAPEWLLHDALAVIDATPQRRPRLRVPWRFPTANFYMKGAVAAVAVIAIGAVGLGVMRSVQGPGVEPSDSPSASPGPSVEPSDSPSPSPEPSVEPSDSPQRRPGRASSHRTVRHRRRAKRRAFAQPVAVISGGNHRLTIVRRPGRREVHPRRQLQQADHVRGP